MRILLKRLLPFAVCAALAAPITAQAQEETSFSTPQELRLLVAEGLTNNKDLQSMRINLQALIDKAPAAGALADPMLGFALANMPTDTFSFNQEAMTQKQVFVSQKLPWFGRLDLRERKALLMAEKQRFAVLARELDLASQVADAYYGLRLVREALSTNEALRQIISKVLKVAETRYATGEGLQQDILLAQVELNQLLEERIELEQNEWALRDKIAGLLNRGKVIPPLADDADMIAPAPDLDKNALTKRALSNNPALLSLRTEVQIAMIDVELSKKDYYPDFDLRVTYGQRDDDPTGNDRPDFLSAAVAMNLPLYASAKQGPALSGSKRQLDAAKLRVQNQETTLPHQVDALITGIKADLDNRRLIRQVLSLQATQWRDSTIAAYQVGKVEFSTLMSATMRQVRFELKQARYLYAAYQKMARLEVLVGANSLMPPQTASAR